MISKTKESIENSISDIRPGDTVKVYQIIKEAAQQNGKTKEEKEKKEKIQIFEGLVLARKHGSEPGATITVRRIIDGVGVEKIFPLHSPLIKKIEIVKRGKVRRAKLYYLRKAKGKRSRLKNLEFTAETLKKETEKNPKEEGPKEKEGTEAESTTLGN